MELFEIILTKCFINKIFYYRILSIFAKMNENRCIFLLRMEMKIKYDGSHI